MSRVNGQEEVDRGRMVLELIERLSVVHAAKCGGQEGILRVRSWSQHR